MPQDLWAKFLKKSAEKAKKLNFKIFGTLFPEVQVEIPLGIILEKTKFNVSK